MELQLFSRWITGNTITYLHDHGYSNSDSPGTNDYPQA
jgi:hypothetical protein